MKANPLVANKRMRKRLQMDFSNDGRTQQNFRDETNINNIMAKFAKGEMITHVNNIQGAYGDFSSVQDYQLHLDQVMAANEAFMALPAQVRRRFDNDPSHLLRFLEDPKNRDEAVALGLIAEPPPPQPKADDKSASGGAAATTTSSAPSAPSGSEKPQA